MSDNNKRNASDRTVFARRIASSGVVVSKTGGARKDPRAIISSNKAQNELRSIIDRLNKDTA